MIHSKLRRHNITKSGFTIIYADGGETYLGELKDEKLDYWFLFGRDARQKLMYKGYRRNNFRNSTDSVIVFDTKPWDANELAKRKQNGFLGIKEYNIKL